MADYNTNDYITRESPLPTPLHTESKDAALPLTPLQKSEEIGLKSIEGTDTIARSEDSQNTSQVFNLPLTDIKAGNPVLAPLDSPKTSEVGEVETLTNEVLVNNLDSFLDEAGQALEASLQSLSLDDPNRAELYNFTQLFYEWSSSIKKTMFRLSASDIETSRILTDEQKIVSDERSKLNKEKIDKQAEMRAKQLSMGIFSFAMKIIGPIISALSTVVGALLAAFTFGASTALIVAGVMAGIAMTAYSTVDSITGVTGKIIQAFTEALEKNKNLSDTDRALIKFATMIGAVLALAVVGTAAASAATQAGAQVTQQAIALAVKQMATQGAIMAVMSSGAIPELVGTLLARQGVSEEGQQIAQTAVIVVEILAIMAMMMRGSSSTGAPQQVAKEVEQTSQNASKISTIIQTIKQGAQSVADIPAHVLNYLQSLKDLPNELKNTVIGIIKNIQTIAQQINPSTTLTPGLFAAYAAATLMKAIEYSQPLAQVIQGITSALALMHLAKTMREASDFEAAQELEQVALDSLKNSTDKLRANMQGTTQAIESIESLWQNILKSLTQSSAKITQALQA
jgi:invasin B